MKAKNPVWANAEKSAINLIVSHPVYGDIAFTASPNDDTDYGPDLFHRAVAGEFGAVAFYGG